ncbi:MAG: DUF512 domain-containing protein [Blautia sp.]|nr:DUF512 domain-containing protein [Blautia sp.]
MGQHKNRHVHVISEVAPGSIAEELELCRGDKLISVSGQVVEDVFDYRYLINDEYITLLVEKADGEVWELEVEKEYDEDLGIEFENSLMDGYRSCSNNCIFCFIDQMPPGMRPTLYFKDDDSRLSFLQGNYVTLTNMSDHDVERIVRYHMEPINISFQTMNPELRCRMLHNRFAGKALQKVDRFFEAGIIMNGQIVLCKGYNDGRELEYSLEKLAEYAPVLQSVSIVPVGLTKYREGLCPLEPFTPEEACEVIDLVHRWQETMMKRHGIHFVHASDEWYILAGQELPPEENYDGYLQLENGVGMLRLLDTEVNGFLSEIPGDDRISEGTIACGLLAEPFLRKHMQAVHDKFPGVNIEVRGIVNHFFGENITVSGLITGQDLISQMKGGKNGKRIFLSSCMLREGEDVFLDDITVSEAEKALDAEITVVQSSGADLLRAVLLMGDSGPKKRRQMYEQTGSGNSGQA